MLRIPQIVVRTIALGGIAAVLAACGQKGDLYLPTDPSGANRATLPQTLDPRGETPEPSLPVAPAAAPQKQ